MAKAGSIPRDNASTTFIPLIFHEVTAREELKRKLIGNNPHFKIDTIQPTYHLLDAGLLEEKSFNDIVKTVREDISRDPTMVEDLAFARKIYDQAKGLYTTLISFPRKTL